MWWSGWVGAAKYRLCRCRCECKVWRCKIDDLMKEQTESDAHLVASAAGLQSHRQILPPGLTERSKMVQEGLYIRKAIHQSPCPFRFSHHLGCASGSSCSMFRCMALYIWICEPRCGTTLPTGVVRRALRDMQKSVYQGWLRNAWVGRKASLYWLLGRLLRHLGGGRLRS